MLQRKNITRTREAHLFIPHFNSVSNNSDYTALDHTMNNVAYDIDESSAGQK
jgi:hypothetical protein